MSRSEQPWTPDQDEALRRAWAAGDRAAEIGAPMGRSSRSVWARAHRLGLPARGRVSGGRPSAWTRAEDDRLREAWSSGAMLKTLTPAFGRSVAAISFRARKLGLPSRQQGPRSALVYYGLKLRDADVVRAAAARRRVSLSHLVRDALRQYLGADL